MPVTKTCEVCEGTFDVTPSRADTARYCSWGCRTTGQNQQETLTCPQCRSEFDAPPSEAERRRFCSNDCRYRHFRENGGPNLGDQVTIECAWCGGEERHPPSVAKSRTFCSVGCLGKWQEENLNGENHPAWKGGYSLYVGGWSRRRRKALERDDHRCIECGMGEEEHQTKFDQGLHVHHIKPIREFDDPTEAHALENLETFCRLCHPDEPTENA